MNRRHLMPSVLVVAVAFAAAPARAATRGRTPRGTRSTSSAASRSSTLAPPRRPRSRCRRFGFPGFPGWPGSGPSDIQVGTETTLGNSALFGLRYAFYLRKQLALEADVAVAPSHDLQGSVDVCGSSACYGRGDYAAPGPSSPSTRR